MTALAEPEIEIETADVAADRLAQLEAVIERGLTTFLEVGHALAAIKTEGLYLIAHTSFAAYLRDRWDLTSAQACQRIYLAEVGDAIVSTGRPLPAAVSANALKELVPLLHDEGPAAVGEAWGRALERCKGRGRGPTSGHVRAVLASTGGRMTAEPPPRKERLWTIGQGLKTAAGKTERMRADLKGRPLPPAQRAAALELAGIAHGIGSALEAMADATPAMERLAVLEGQRAPEPKGKLGEVFCDRHATAGRDRDGRCMDCGLPDLRRAA